MHSASVYPALWGYEGAAGEHANLALTLKVSLVIFLPFSLRTYVKKFKVRIADDLDFKLDLLEIDPGKGL